MKRILSVIFLVLLSNANLNAKTTASEKDEVINFVVDWFSLFDKNADAEQFKSKMVKEDLHFKFPEANLRSHSDFDNWYLNVRKNFKNPSHSIKQIEVKKNKFGSYTVDIIVVWKAIDRKTNKGIRFEARQLWKLVHENKILKIKTYFVQENN